MAILFWIASSIDFILLLVCLYETYAVSSNSSWAKPALLLFILLIAGVWFRKTKPALALALVGIPAGAALLFALVFVIMMMAGNGRWQ